MRFSVLAAWPALFVSLAPVVFGALPPQARIVEAETGSENRVTTGEVVR